MRQMCLLLACAALATVSNAVNVLVVYSADAFDATKSVALAIADGANSTTGAVVRCLDVERTNYDLDVKWADVVVLGSGVYNGNAAPSMLGLINSFDPMDDFTSKVGGSFATGGAVAAGVQTVIEQLNRFVNP